MANGVNVAAIFDTKKGKALPVTFNGVPVIDGDLTDYRPADDKGVIVGLRWKHIANRENNIAIQQSKFVVKANGLNPVTQSDIVLTVIA